MLLTPWPRLRALECASVQRRRKSAAREPRALDPGPGRDRHRARRAGSGARRHACSRTRARASPCSTATPWARRASATRFEPRAARRAASALDVADGARIAAVIAEARAAFGPIDILVNNAGIALAAPIGAADFEAAWEATLAVNLTAHTRTVRACLDDLRRHREGRIVNIASTEGPRGDRLHQRLHGIEARRDRAHARARRRARSRAASP